MTGDLDMGTNNILNVENLTDYKVDDPIDYRIKDLKSAVNKEYLNTKFLKMDKNDNYFDLRQNIIKNCEPYYDGLFDNNSLVSKAFVDAEIAKIDTTDTTYLLPLDGSRVMTGDLMMNSNHIFNIENLTDYKDDDDLFFREKDLKSVVNKQYLNNNFIKLRSKDGVDFYDLKQGVIKNCEPYYGGLFDDNSLVSKAFVDAEIGKIDTSDLLLRDGSRPMTGNLNMGYKNIIGISGSSK